MPLLKMKSVMATIAWLPLRSSSSLFSFLTAIPRRSASGSVPITISAPIALAFSIAICRASGSSGFGDLTVGKSPSGLACSSIIETCLYPAFSRTCGMAVTEVPCKGVNTTFTFSRFPFPIRPTATEAS